MRRFVAPVARVGLVVLAGGTLLHTTSAGAEDLVAPTLGGFQGTAAASVIRAFYNPEGVLPIAAPVDLSAPDALATIAAGPATFARASTADPGDLLVNPDALLTAGNASYPSGTIPAYPYRISASNGTGEPSNHVAPAPGLDASVMANDRGSRAESTTPRFATPAIVTAGSARSIATTRTDGSSVTVTSQSSISDVSVLGLVSIDSVITELTATTDGATTTTSGGTVISGATALGRPVTIDADGIHAKKGASGSESTTVKTLNQVLNKLGVRISVASPVQLGKKTSSGQLTSAGIRIDIEVSHTTYPQIGDLLDRLPAMPTLVPGAPGPADVLALVRARNLVTVGIGGAEVNLSARSARATRSAVSADAPFLPSGSISEAPSFGDAAVSFGDLPPALTNSTQISRPIGTSRRPVPAGGFGAGVGLLAVVGLLLQPLLAERLSRAASMVLAADPTAVCPRERT